MLFPLPFRELCQESLPWVTFGVLAVFLLTFVASAIGWPTAPEPGYGLIPAAVNPVAFATHWLWHENWAHLLATAVTLVFVGPVLEERWGRIGFASLIVGGIVLTTAAQIAAPGDLSRPLVGVNGLLALLLMATVVRHFECGLDYTAVGWWQGWIHTRFWIPSYALLGGWFAFEVLMQVSNDAVGSTRGMSYTGILCGGALGAALGFWLPKSGWEERLRPRRSYDPETALAAAHRALENESPDAALASLEPAIAMKPEHAEVVTRYCEIAVEEERHERAKPIFIACVRALVTSKDSAQAAGLWNRFASPLGRPLLPQRTQLALAEALCEAHHTEEAAHALRALLRAKNVTMGLALRITDLADGVHSGVALEAARQALALGQGLPEAKRARIATRIEEFEARHQAIPDPPIEDLAEPSTSEVADPNDRSLAVGLDDDDLREPPPGYQAPENAVTGPRALTLDGDLDETNDAPLASDECLEPEPSMSPPDSVLDVPSTLPVLNPVGAAAHTAPSTAPGHAPSPGNSDRSLPPMRAAEGDATSLDPESAVPPQSNAEPSGDEIWELDEAPDETITPLGDARDTPAPLERHASQPEASLGSRTGSSEPLIETQSESIATSIRASDENIDLALDALDLGDANARFFRAKRVEVSVDAFNDRTLVLRQATGTAVSLDIGQVQAIATGAVTGLDVRPVLLIDLLLNWNDVSAETTLRIVRLRSDRIAPSVLSNDEGSSADALRGLLKDLLVASGAHPLPDVERATGQPFARFSDLGSYERDVLQLAE